MTLLTTIISKTEGQRIVVDAGFKSISGDRGLPSVKGIDGVTLKRLNAEHAIIHLENPSVALEAGDKIELQVHDSDPTINLHDRLFGIRNGVVEELLRLEG